MNHDSIISVNSGTAVELPGGPEPKKTIDDAAGPSNQIYM